MVNEEFDVYACMYFFTCMHDSLCVCYACMHICILACVHVFMHTCFSVCIFANIHICMFDYMHVCMYATLHVCMCPFVYACMPDACTCVSLKPLKAAFTPCICFLMFKNHRQAPSSLLVYGYLP